MENLWMESICSCLTRARNMLKARHVGNARNHFFCFFVFGGQGEIEREKWSTEEGWWFRKEFRGSLWTFVNCKAESQLLSLIENLSDAEDMRLGAYPIPTLSKSLNGRAGEGWQTVGYNAFVTKKAIIYGLWLNLGWKEETLNLTSLVRVGKNKYRQCLGAHWFLFNPFIF